MAIPFFIFWVLVLLCRKDLGWRGAGICLAIWAALFLGAFYSGLPAEYFVIAQVLLDIVLILVLFGGDVRIR